MRISRRGAVAGTVAAGTMARWGGVRAQAVKELRMIEAGGLSGDSMEPYIKPFTAATGIKVVRESPNPFGKLRTLVQAGNSGISLFEVGSTSLEQAKALNLIEPLDWAALDPEPIYPESRNEFGLGWQYYSTLMAWRSDAKPLTSWADFFDVKGFPGKRTMQDRPYMIPFALLADGVPKEKLYPLDLNRAFKKLDTIKDSVSVWWAAGAQPPQLLADNEVQYGVSYSGRVTGKPALGYTFEAAALDCSFMAVVKGTPAGEKAAAMRLLHEYTIARNEAEAARIVSYTGASTQLTPLLPQDKLKEFPTVAKDRQFINDTKWWFDNAETVEKRWQQFKLGL